MHIKKITKMMKEESIWEDAVDLQKHFPHLNLESKVHVREEGDDKPNKKDSRSFSLYFSNFLVINS